LPLAGYALGSAPRLLRLAHQLTGDLDHAVNVVVRALSHTSARRMRGENPSVALDEAVQISVVRLALRDAAPTSTTPSALDRLSHRARACVVLGLGVGWDADGIAEATGMSARRVRADVHAALELVDENTWRRLLDDPMWSVPTPPDLVDRSATGIRSRRMRERRVLVGAAVVLVALAGIADVVGRAATAPVPVPAAAHVRGLLDWPVRGDLVRDRGLIRAASRIWATTSAGPAGEIHVLWAGHVGVGRLVVLQAIGPGGPAIAVIADHDISFRHPRLRLDEVDPLPNTDVPFLAVPYDGNLNIPGLEPGPGSRVVQLLTAPDVTGIEQRRVLDNEVLPLTRPAFAPEPIAAGLTEPWLDLSGQRPDTAVLVHRRRVSTLVELVQEGLIPVGATPHIAPAPPSWDGLLADMDFRSPTLADDAVWWDQVCRAPDVEVSPIWSSGSGATSGLRVERYTCPGDDPVAVLLRGVNANAIWPAAAVDSRAGADPIVLRVAARGLQQASTDVIGPTTLGRIVIGGASFTGRTASFVGSSALPVAVYDRRGKPMSLLILSARYPG
jgi:hypothetical protein